MAADETVVDSAAGSNQARLAVRAQLLPGRTGSVHGLRPGIAGDPALARGFERGARGDPRGRETSPGPTAIPPGAGARAKGLDPPTPMTSGTPRGGRTGIRSRDYLPGNPR